MVLTGVILGDRHGAVAYDSKADTFIGAFNEHIPYSFHGTGDTFSSVLVGALTRGMALPHALQTAVDFTHACMIATLPEREKHAYGVKFEECIPLLVSLCKER